VFGGGFGGCDFVVVVVVAGMMATMMVVIDDGRPPLHISYAIEQPLTLSTHSPPTRATIHSFLSLAAHTQAQ